MEFLLINEIGQSVTAGNAQIKLNENTLNPLR